MTVHMSIMHMCNANGVTLPPLYVFAGVKLLHNMLEGAPKGKFTLYFISKKCLNFFLFLIACMFF